MDATIVAAAHNPPSREAGMGAAHPREPGADWTNKNGKSYFGYKLHIGMDEQSGIVRRAAFTPARRSDSEEADGLLCRDEKAAYGDRAYEEKERRKALKTARIKDRIMHRRHKHLPVLPHWQERRNQLIARRRAPVDAVFSAMKRLYGLARARCHSLKRNATDVFAFLTALNIQRAIAKSA
jgi:IS5 family transposase